ncbi:MAG: ATP-binding protein [bacterium]|nr:ATP-binding protein [bacterium]
MFDENCPICEGTGWERIVEDGFEKVKRCQCYYQVRRKRLLLAARIPRRYSHCTLEQFKVSEHDYEEIAKKGKGLDPSKHQVNIAVAKFAAENFIRQYPTRKEGILFMGNCGVGKTHLSVAIIRELIEKKGVPCMFYDFRDLLKEIQASYDPQSQTSEFFVLDPVLTIDVLLLDELGAARVTDWMLDTLTYILNTRYNENLTTIITSNWLDEKKDNNEQTLEDRIGKRLRSRLSEMCKVYEIIGPDFRRKGGRIFS